MSIFLELEGKPAAASGVEAVRECLSLRVHDGVTAGLVAEPGFVVFST